MPLKARIEDASGSGREAFVTKEHGLRVGIYPPDLHAPGIPNRYRYYSVLLGSTGADAGTTNMGVDGSATAEEFYVAAHKDYDIRVMAASILIGDTAVSHDAFGAVAALGTGWDLKVLEEGETTYIIEKAKTGGQVIAQAGGFWGYGDGVLAWELANWVTGPPAEDAQLVVFPMYLFIPGGFRIARGSLNKIVSVVNDNLTGLTLFNVRLMGYRHYPKET